MYKVEVVFRGITGCGMYNTDDKTISVKEFETRKEAKKEIRRLIKEEGFINGYYVHNPSNNLEIHVNF